MEPDSKTALDLLLWNRYKRDIFLNSLCALFEFFAKQNFNRGIIKLNTFFSIYSSFSVKIVFRIHNFIQNYQMRRKHKIWGTEVETFDTRLHWAKLFCRHTWFKPFTVLELNKSNKTTIWEIMKVEQVYSLRDVFYEGLGNEAFSFLIVFNGK